MRATQATARSSRGDARESSFTGKEEQQRLVRDNCYVAIEEPGRRASRRPSATPRLERPRRRLFLRARASRASSATARRHPTTLPRPIAALRAERATAIAAGHDASSCAESGALYTFGYGVVLGHGGKQNELAPRRVEAIAGVRIVLAAGGEHHSLVIDDAGIP